MLLLGSMLQTLTLRITCEQYFPNFAADFVAELPTLQSLSLDLHQEDVTCLTNLMRVLSAPNIRQLYFFCVSITRDISRRALEVLFPAAEARWPHMCILVGLVVVPNDQDQSTQNPLDVVFQRLPPLRFLKFVSDLPQPSSLRLHESLRKGDGIFLPPLEELRLNFREEGMDSTFIHFIRDVIYAPDFRQLQVVRTSIDPEVVKEMLPDFKYTNPNPEHA